MIRYRPVHEARKFFVRVNGMRHCIREWGDARLPAILMLHGHMDSSITFQFLADRLASGFRVVAPDLRGFGETQWVSQGYSFEDYLNDVDGVIGKLFFKPVAVLGHSLGGNLAMMFAGIRADKVNAVISLDGFGMSDPEPDTITAHYRRWLNTKRSMPPAQQLGDLDDAVKRLIRSNPNLSPDKARFLAARLTIRKEGRLSWRFDPAHRGPFPRPYRSSDWLQAIQEIKAPVLWIGSDQPYPQSLAVRHPTLQDRLGLCGADFQRVVGASHNLHHDAPDVVAAHVMRLLLSVG
ncbi:alpha/beta hydrolase [Rhizobium sp. 16-449-1b]|uniref:alpha/beta fold hydrolase n=1 Tax=Rhizobium sp. 16-449-1b TaxID=2819989 RepID=UPI001ADAC89D|nr:alpha/beta hydrolase [Rhizobium sp. 16-449-1b]MBO9195438.1 alpha/beta hydrolase [Rhizobium sp. 16-449-1b]